MPWLLFTLFFYILNCVLILPSTFLLSMSIGAVFTLSIRVNG